MKKRKKISKAEREMQLRETRLELTVLITDAKPTADDLKMFKKVTS